MLISVNIRVGQLIFYQAVVKIVICDEFYENWPRNHGGKIKISFPFLTRNDDKFWVFMVSWAILVRIRRRLLLVKKIYNF